MTLVDFSTLEMCNMLSLVKLMLRDTVDIPLGHFFWMTIPENLAKSKINSKKIIYNCYNNHISGAKSHKINLTITKVTGNRFL